MRLTCAEAPTRRGQRLKEALDDLGLRHRDAKIATAGDSIRIPLARPPSGEELERIRGEVPEAVLVEAEVEVRERGPRSLQEAMEGRVPHELMERVPTSYDVVGDIAMVRLPEELEEYGAEVGEALLAVHPSLETVLAKEAAVSGEFRTRRHRLLAGEDKRETVHREHGCLFAVDVERAYFSPRLSTERERVFRQVREGEFVVDMFSGVGPFAIAIAKHRNPSRVVAMDKNPEAFRLLVENVQLNDVADTVQPVLGDAREAAEKYGALADRVIMNLPKSADAFLDTAVDLLKPGGGIIHYYEITGDVRETVERVKRRVRAAGREPVVRGTREVRTYSAEESQWAVDVEAGK